MVRFTGTNKIIKINIFLNETNIDNVAQLVERENTHDSMYGVQLLAFPKKNIYSFFSKNS